MADPHHALATEIARLNAMERHIIDRFIHRQRVARDITATPMRFGDRLADRVAAFGGSWAFILIAVAAISVWMLINVMLNNVRRLAVLAHHDDRCLERRRTGKHEIQEDVRIGIEGIL
jgi:uncharacterized membrane protein